MRGVGPALYMFNIRSSTLGLVHFSLCGGVTRESGGPELKYSFAELKYSFLHFNENLKYCPHIEIYIEYSASTDHSRLSMGPLDTIVARHYIY